MYICLREILSKRERINILFLRLFFLFFMLFCTFILYYKKNPVPFPSTKDSKMMRIKKNNRKKKVKDLNLIPDNYEWVHLSPTFYLR